MYEQLTNIEINKGIKYIYPNFPSSISNAIFLYGDSSDFDILVYVDLSSTQDGSRGILITKLGFYFNLSKSGSFKYDEIKSLTYKQNKTIKYCTIQTENSIYTFTNNMFNIEQLCSILNTLTNIEISYNLDNNNKIVYNSIIILDDIRNDEYEDLELTNEQLEKLNTLKHDLNEIIQLEDQAFIIEIQLYLSRILNFVEELELDSDEIDELINISNSFNSKENDMINNAKNMMHNMGYDMDSLKDKSPEQLNKMLDDLCARFNISRDQVEQLAKKFKK